jgi:hypothetical protein
MRSVEKGQKHLEMSFFFANSYVLMSGSVAIEALCYKPDDRGVETRRGE